METDGTNGSISILYNELEGTLIMSVDQVIYAHGGIMFPKIAFLLLTSIVLSLVLSPTAAQSDLLPTINDLLDQAGVYLESDDLLTAQVLITSANALIVSDLVAECATLDAAKTLLEIAEEAETIGDARPLLIGARVLIDDCAGPAREVVPSTPEPTNAPSLNAAWTPVEQEFEGLTMVQVPAGCFMMGSTDEQIEAAKVMMEEGDLMSAFLSSERPAHEICLDEPFWIDKYEVTNAEYARFVQAGGYENSDYWTEAGWQKRQEEEWAGPWAARDAGDDQPVRASWYEAVAYANWRGVGLCTEAQWEYAARGPDGLVYPWGNEFNADYVAYYGNSNRTLNVGSHPEGASWVGALDMSGNADEWVLSANFAYPYSPDDGRNDVNTGSRRPLRGGSWESKTPDRVRTAFRSNYANNAYRRSGFRTCRPVD